MGLSLAFEMMMSTVLLLVQNGEAPGVPRASGGEAATSRCFAWAAGEHVLPRRPEGLSFAPFLSAVCKVYIPSMHTINTSSVSCQEERGDNLGAETKSPYAIVGDARGSSRRRIEGSDADDRLACDFKRWRACRSDMLLRPLRETAGTVCKTVDWQGGLFRASWTIGKEAVHG